MLHSSRSRAVTVILVGLLLGSLGASSVQAQTIDCAAPAPTTPGVITTGRPYTIAFCIPIVIAVANPDGTSTDVPNRVEGYTAVLDGGAPVELGKLTPGAPSPTVNLQPVSYRTNSGVAKGNHTVVVTPWNCPLDATGNPPATCATAQHQNASPVSIPFVVTDVLLTGAPPPIQKGRVSR